MTAKRKITDKNGVQVFPITHTKAVIDDNGNSVEERLQEQMDLINQKQLEVGAVPSDVTPTEGSANWVTSGGVYNAIQGVQSELTEFEWVELDSLYIRNSYIQQNNIWSTSGHHVMIYVEGYSKVSIKSNDSENCTVALLKSAARTGTADYATGAARTNVPVGSIITLDIPSDAKYLYVIFGADTSYPQKPDYVKLYSDKFNKLNDKLDNYTETLYTASGFQNAGILLQDGSIQNNNTTKNYRTSDFIQVEHDMMLIYKDVYPVVGSFVGICVYDYQKQQILPNPAIGSEVVNNGVIDLSRYKDVSYVRISTNAVISSTTTSIKLRKNYTLGDIADIIDNVSGKTITEKYGCTTSSNRDNPTNILYMSSNTPCVKSGLIENISGTFKYAGTAVITTGFIDQNGFMITGKEYNVTIPSAGFNSVNIEDKGIIINEGEFLLAKKTGNCYPNFGVGASSAIGLSVNLDNHVEIREDNVYFSFAWSVKTIVPDYETLAYNVSEQKIELASLRETVANIDTSGVVIDQETGVPYIITIRNGQIVPVPTLYRNVLVLGNSITVHPQTSIWPADNRGMAATKPEYDFCGIMQTQMRLKDNSTVVTRLNIADWERKFTTNLSTLIGNNLTSNTDLVIIRLGENVTNNDEFGNALNNLLAYIYGIAQNARIIVTSMFWVNSTKDEILKNFADSHGLTYVKINQYGNSTYEEAIGHYTYNTDFSVISEITNSGVAQHPSNKGMCMIANEILGALGYERSSNTYSLQSITVGGVTGNMYVLSGITE